MKYTVHKAGEEKYHLGAEGDWSKKEPDKSRS